jgi:hypothetical protein
MALIIDSIPFCLGPNVMDVRHPTGIAIVLAHRKKPADETRLCEKLAYSIQMALPHAKVHCLGTQPVQGNCGFGGRLFGAFSGKAGFLNWLRDGISFFQYLFGNRPTVLVVASADLYFWAWLWKKAVPSCRLIFDVQENQGLNFRCQMAYSRSVLSRASTLWTQAEVFFFQHADAVWLAEAIYQSQLNLFPSTILENKVPAMWAPILPQAPEEPIFFFSGVLTEEAGIRDVVSQFRKIHSRWPHARLQIAGFSPDPGMQQFLFSQSSDPESGISVIGGTTWIRSSEVAEALSKAFIVCVGYRETLANDGKHPTKMFEAGYFEKPILVKPESHFWSFAETLGRVVAWRDPEIEPDFIENLKQMWEVERGKSGLIKRVDCQFEVETAGKAIKSILTA